MRSFSSDDFKWHVRETSEDHKLIRRIQVNQFPSYISSRHPENWGFIMESCWVLWTSFPMPLRGLDKYLEDRSLSVKVNDQLEEVHSYNFNNAGFYNTLNDTLNGNNGFWNMINDDEDDDDDDDDDEDDDDYYPPDYTFHEAEEEQNGEEYNNGSMQDMEESFAESSVPD
eukprot:CAMPEP_0197519682 /NCGR_PEP_ID=MMETSP1318-20131121/4955_1 /TAXON_ID=552666 /ORGANISM="Partenskyella glossopodia, Strain RCC365" /LENGTH=169 /DNA_ID=CAMNT_0043070811 /DNA_START=381 /DNA_END=890 /DNA_ORIENTATION=-